MFTSLKRSYCRLFAMALTCASAIGCDQGVDDVYPAALATAKGQLAIGPVQEMIGAYGSGCVGRQGAWSVGLGGGGALTNPALSVQQNNVACELTLQSLRIGATPESSVLYVAAPPIVLHSAYAATPSGFAADGMGPAVFYGNAALLPDNSFSSNFVIQVVYSEDPAVTSIDKLATPALAVQGGVSIEGVPVPDYVTSLDGLTIRTNLLHVVTSVSGNVALSAAAEGSQSGEEYAVLPFDFGSQPSYADVNAAFVAVPHGTIAGPEASISWDALELLGESLTSPVVRTIIISHSVAGIRAYQLIKLSISE